MSISKDIYKPIYRIIPSTLKPRFESGELDVKCLFFVSELAYEVESFILYPLLLDFLLIFRNSLLNRYAKDILIQKLLD